MEALCKQPVFPHFPRGFQPIILGFPFFYVENFFYKRYILRRKPFQGDRNFPGKAGIKMGKCYYIW